MSMLWMSFVRDVRLLWEDGAAIPRMVSVSDQPAACYEETGAPATIGFPFATSKIITY